MSKKFNNFLNSNKTAVRRVCYAWIVLILVAMIGFCVYFMYFADWSSVQLTRDIGVTPSQYMCLISVTVTDALAIYIISPAWAILNKIKKLSA